MSHTLENNLQLGNGIFTTSEIAEILQLPYQKVRKWILQYWDGKLGSIYKKNYSWQIDNNRAVGFHTLIEFYVMMQFAERGIKVSAVLKAHNVLAEKFNTHFPFAHSEVVNNIHTDGYKIYIKSNGDLITLDGTEQLNLEFIKMFFKKLDFGNDCLATRFWPLGKKANVVCDPHHKFGQPVIKDTSIQTIAIYKMYQAEEPIKFIASIYDISVKSVKDAVKFHQSAA
ncbi:DUF433 domain-containing protein [Flavobacterium salilacus subsp. salilacus]|uniref:DUF433 domain-containing protein n=1 Tax=Flavobacterium TaxID=237 RepID=UPI00107516F9|nr:MULTISPECIES: DUF433 domain-containing protein [Flavobacterium]KAF2519928.1 DUF433 domain-containing protein [Flavobacterium salilacus subsp. salilacus]MBE1614161.1 DUF433 domain-containing protein [Flavobacterium sp. SaA2.13]